ncbi:MAG: zinc ribbon domain-containing protein [Acidobacteriota bacterium]|nr:zinc ribbon domain-containing protein [Acidobacteriota bacterium]
MHCPRCGQQQVSEETKFCSRCGFPLGLVAEVLSHGGFLPQLAQLNEKKTLLTRKNGVVFSVFWFMFFTLLLTSIFGIAGAEAMTGISAVIGVFGGLMIMIASLLLLNPARKNINYPNNMEIPAANPQTLYGAPQKNALPPQQTIPTSGYVPPAAGNWRDTNDLTKTSVTENTTKLLSKDE